MIKQRDDNDNLNGGHHDGEPSGVGFPSQQNPSEPHVGDWPEIPGTVGRQRQPVGGGMNDRKNVFDHQRPRGKNDEEMGKENDPCAGCSICGWGMRLLPYGA